MKVEPYKYTETEINVELAKGALEVFLLSSEAQEYKDIQKISASVTGVHLVKANGKKVTRSPINKKIDYAPTKI